MWRVDGKEKSLLPDIEQSKFYTGDCYIFQYTYSGDDQEDCRMGAWIGKQSIDVIHVQTHYNPISLVILNILISIYIINPQLSQHK